MSPAGQGRLQGQVSLITGGASGLGRAIVDRFVAEGARVAVLDRSVQGLETLAEDHGERVTGIAGDVRSLASNQEAVRRCVEGFGRLDCAIANAGIWDYGMHIVDLPDDKLEQAFDELMGANLKGPRHAGRRVLSSLLDTALGRAVPDRERV